MVAATALFLPSEESWTFGGALASFWFLTGPAIEADGTYFRRWNGVCTILLFLAGLAFTAFAALVSVVTC